MKLINNWRSAWRMLSVQVAALAVIFGALPADQQAAILAWIGLAPERIPAVMGLAVIVARIIGQSAVSSDAGRLQPDQ
jgi:hypothetical protein